MARARIKKGILEFSTNPDRRELIKKYILEVRCSVKNQLTHAYMILGKKRKKNE